HPPLCICHLLARCAADSALHRGTTGWRDLTAAVFALVPPIAQQAGSDGCCALLSSTQDHVICYVDFIGHYAVTSFNLSAPNWCRHVSITSCSVAGLGMMRIPPLPSWSSKCHLVCFMPDALA